MNNNNNNKTKPAVQHPVHTSVTGKQAEASTSFIPGFPRTQPPTFWPCSHSPVVGNKRDVTVQHSLFRPRLRGEDFLLLLFVIFVYFIYALDFLHAIGELPGFLSRATPCHGEVSEPKDTSRITTSFLFSYTEK